jgi:transcriptional regulator with XRE-family HTH domain
MPWKTISMKALADSLGIDYAEIEQKHELIKKIAAARKKQGLTQAQLAKKLGVSQARIAKIETRIETQSISFEALFKILAVLGYTCRVTTKRRAQGAKSRLAA